MSVQSIKSNLFNVQDLKARYASKASQPNFKGNELNLRIYKYVNEFNLIFSKDMRYTPINAEIVKNEFYKINNNRAIFVTSANNNLYFYLFDFFNEYTKIIISIYESLAFIKSFFNSSFFIYQHPPNP